MSEYPTPAMSEYPTPMDRLNGLVGTVGVCEVLRRLADQIEDGYIALVTGFDMPFYSALSRGSIGVKFEWPQVEETHG